VILALSNLLENTIANLLAGLILALFTLFLYQERKRRREEQEQRLEARIDEEKRKIAVLEQVRDELSWNQSVVPEIRDPKRTTPAILFTVHGWELLRQGTVLTELDSHTVSALVGTYRALSIVNEAHRLAAEHAYGPTQTIVKYVAKTQNAWPQIEQEYWTEKREWYFDKLLEYLDAMELDELTTDWKHGKTAIPAKDPEPKLELAIEAIDTELRRASERKKKHEDRRNELTNQSLLAGVRELVFGTKSDRERDEVG
jgi:hypothetical protein